MFIESVSVRVSVEISDFVVLKWVSMVWFFLLGGGGVGLLVG